MFFDLPITMGAVFCVLFALIRLFERDRRAELRGFDISTAAILPILLGGVIGVAGSLIGFSPWSVYLAGIVVLVATFLTLWKSLEIPGPRSAVYACGALLTAVVTPLCLAMLIG